ncbi:hypothetical protein F0U59_25810 [Archangium gephyra]|nr:hypothetical protein F0U59_25810 [Archangium gephyra]
MKLHRELAESCPAFTPNLLELARLLRLDNNPPANLTSEAMEGELRQLLEQAVAASGRSASAVVELAYFLDIFHNSLVLKEDPGVFTEGAPAWRDGGKALS